MGAVGRAEAAEDLLGIGPPGGTDRVEDAGAVLGSSTRVARRSLGSGRRWIRSRASRASTTSVVDRGAMCRCSESSDRRICPCRLSTRRARR